MYNPKRKNNISSLSIKPYPSHNLLKMVDSAQNIKQPTRKMDFLFHKLKPSHFYKPHKNGCISP